MQSTRPVLNRLDTQRLESHLTAGFGAPWPILHLRELRERARVVEPRQIPADIVTMHCSVTVYDPQWETMETYTLVYPSPPLFTADASPVGEVVIDMPRAGDAATTCSEAVLGTDCGELVVTSHMGAALLSKREGDEVRWISPRGPRWVFVERIDFQPERSGRFDL